MLFKVEEETHVCQCVVCVCVLGRGVVVRERPSVSLRLIILAHGLFTVTGM